jgi:hypothetical protein
MKCLETCRKILNNESVDENALSEFIAEYCISQGREDGLKYIPVFMQLVHMGQFDIFDAIKRYCISNDKQLISLIYNGNAIKHWIVE